MPKKQGSVQVQVQPGYWGTRLRRSRTRPEARPSGSIQLQGDRRGCGRVSQTEAFFNRSPCSRCPPHALAKGLDQSGATQGVAARLLAVANLTVKTNFRSFAARFLRMGQGLLPTNLANHRNWEIGGDGREEKKGEVDDSPPFEAVGMEPVQTCLATEPGAHSLEKRGLLVIELEVFLRSSSFLGFTLASWAWSIERGRDRDGIHLTNGPGRFFCRVRGFQHAHDRQGRRNRCSPSGGRSRRGRAGS